jgi:hypothetical protein
VGGKSKSVTVGFEYYAGMHIVACHGPIDKVHRIVVGERDAWVGGIGTSSQIAINKPDLFGGKEREGGVKGAVDLEFGTQAQGRNSYLAGLLGADVPAHIGVFGMVLRKVMLSMMNPYVKPWAVEAQRIHKAELGATQWYDAKAAIPSGEYRQPLPDTPLPNGPGYLATSSGIGNSPTLPTIPNGDIIRAGDTIVLFTVTNDASVTFASGWATAIYGGFPYSSGAPRVQITLRTATGDEADHQADLTVDGVSSPPQWVCSVVRGVTGIDSRYPGSFFVGANLTDIVSQYGNLLTNKAGGDGQTYVKLAVLGHTTNALPPAGIRWTSVPPTVTEIAHVQGDFVLPPHPYMYNDLIAVMKLHTNAIDSIDTIGGEFGTNGGGNGTGGQIGTAISLQYGGTTPTAEELVDMNPSHIVRECLTNKEWGLGYSAGDINDASFTAAADTLYAEGFGLSMLWDQQSKIEDFVKMVLRHIDGFVYVDPQTGLFSIKLVRGDYTLGSLATLTKAEIASVESFARTAAGEMANTVTVQWLDRNNKRQTATARDLAGIQAFGQEIAVSVDMPGITRSDLAQRVAFRELGQLSRPLAKLTIIVTRAAAGQTIGGVVKITLPEYALSATPMRIVGISYGQLADGKIRMDLVEDVFSLPTYTYTADTDSEWVTTATYPAEAPYRMQMEAPYWQVIKQITGESAAALAEVDPDGGFLLAGASGMSADTSSYTIATRQGFADFVEQANGDPTPGGTLTDPLTLTGTSITIANPYLLAFTELNKWAILEPGTANEEIVAIKTLDATTGVATIARGILDTVPHAHAAGTRIFLLEDDNFIDDDQYLAAESVDIRTLPKTTLGKLSVAVAATDAYTFAARFSRPYPPGNMKINGVAYPTDPVLDVLTITWAHRDRTLQTAYLVEQSEASIGPEATTTYNGYLIDDDTDAVLVTSTGMTGTTWSPTLVGVFNLRVELEAERGGYISWQRQSQTIFYGADSRTLEDGQIRATEAGTIRAQE